MVKKLITVELASGLEARPAAMLVQVASQYESAIYLEAEAKRVNAKSIMGMMTLCLTAGDCFVFRNSFTCLVLFSFICIYDKLLLE